MTPRGYFSLKYYTVIGFKMSHYLQNPITMLTLLWKFYMKSPSARFATSKNGQWLWLSWWNGRFRYQKSAVRIQTKMKKKRPWVALLKKRIDWRWHHVYIYSIFPKKKKFLSRRQMSKVVFSVSRWIIFGWWNIFWYRKVFKILKIVSTSDKTMAHRYDSRAKLETENTHLLTKGK